MQQIYPFQQKWTLIIRDNGYFGYFFILTISVNSVKDGTKQEKLLISNYFFVTEVLNDK